MSTHYQVCVCRCVGVNILNNPPAVIGVGGLHHLLRAVPPPALFPRFLFGKQPTGPPGGGQAAGPARRAGRAPAGRARSGSTLERHGPKKWSQARSCGIGVAILEQIPCTRLKVEHPWFLFPKSEILQKISLILLTESQFSWTLFTSRYL